jgi:hypothetical protein
MNNIDNLKKKNFRIASIGMGIGAVLFFAGATALFTLSKSPEGGWLQLGCGATFLATALVFWWIGRET